MKKIFVGKIVFLFLIFALSFRGGLENYVDLSIFVVTLVAGLCIRLIYSRIVKNEKLQKYASFSYVGFGFIWTIVLGFVQIGGTDRLEVRIWLPIFFGLIFSILDDLIFRSNINSQNRISRRKYIGVLFGVGVMVMLLVINGLHSVVYYINGPSLVYILIVVVPMLLITDTFGDVLNGIRFAMTKKVELTTRELNAARAGFKLVIIGVIIGCLISFINIMPYIINSDDAAMLEAYVNVSMITPLYGIIFSGFIAIVNTIIEKEIIYRES